MMILQGDQHQGIDFHCDTHVSVLKAADFIKALLLGLQCPLGHCSSSWPKKPLHHLGPCLVNKVGDQPEDPFTVS